MAGADDKAGKGPAKPGAPGPSSPGFVDPVTLWTALTTQWLGFMSGFTRTLLAAEAAASKPSTETQETATDAAPPDPPHAEATATPPRAPVPSPRPAAPERLRKPIAGARPGPASDQPKGAAAPSKSRAGSRTFAQPAAALRASSAGPAAAPVPDDAALDAAMRGEAGAKAAKRKVGGASVAEGDALVAAMTAALKSVPSAKPLATAKAKPVAPVAAAAAAGDELRQVKGIGNRMSAALAAQGVTTLEQLAGWDAAAARDFGAAVGAPGRVEREDWIGQAQRLVAAKRRPDKSHIL